MLTNKRLAHKSDSAYIVYVNPQTQKEKTLEISINRPEFTIGRGAGCDLVVNNPVISRKHCSIKLNENGDWIILDKSSSGTFVNRERIIKGLSHLLNNDDTITLSGPFNYPFYFYIGDSFMKKKKKLSSTKATKDDKENLINKDALVILSSEDDDQGGRINSSINERRGSHINEVFLRDEYKNIKKSKNSDDSNNNGKSINKVDDEDNIITQEDENIIDHLLIDSKSVTDGKKKLKEIPTLPVDEKSLRIDNLKLELQVLECRYRFNNEMVDNLKAELNDVKKALVEKENELKTVEDSLFNVKRDEVNMVERVKNEATTKFKEDIMELLENELQCSICNEIIIEAAVLNCTHLFCYVCINTWMKKKKECAVCRTQIKDIVKSRALDSFVDKLMQKYSAFDSLEHRKQIVEERKKDNTPLIRPHRHQRQARNGRGGGGRAEQDAARRDLAQAVAAIPRPPLFRVINRFIPEMEQLPADLADDLNDFNNELLANNELMHEILPIVNLANDAIDLRINRRLRRNRRGLPTIRIQPLNRRDFRDIIDLRDSPDRE